MATRHEDEGGSRLWRGMRSLLFGDGDVDALRQLPLDGFAENERRNLFPHRLGLSGHAEVQRRRTMDDSPLEQPSRRDKCS